MKSCLVMMSSYNGEKYIGEQIESIMMQEDVEIHLCIRDDGSTDSTVEIIKKKQEEFKNIELSIGENIGFGKSFMSILYNSGDFDFYAFSDQDDVWDRRKIISVIQIMDEDGPCLGFTNAVESKENLEITNILYGETYEIPSKYMTFEESVCHGFLMVFNKSLRDLVNMYKGDIYISHDLWVAAVCSFLGGRIVYRNEILANHRRLDNSVSRSFKHKVFAHRLKNLIKYEGREINSARILVSTWHNLLQKEDLDYLENVLCYRNSIESKLFLLKCPQLTRSTKIETILLKLKILLNRF